ncbi:unnamed protein product [Prorocentrum cordatum]|uniref:Uncharacterized protein n=1 Tax=Prorocentrum cordatum TaxID=2364126 RepID=A0ABN9X7W2_9DINO|nr:unnamed protein product [Polarella glacialis]
MATAKDDAKADREDAEQAWAEAKLWKQSYLEDPSLKICENLKKGEKPREEKTRNADLQRRLRVVQTGCYAAIGRVNFYELTLDLFTFGKGLLRASTASAPPMLYDVWYVPEEEGADEDDATRDPCAALLARGGPGSCAGGQGAPETRAAAGKLQTFRCPSGEDSDDELCQGHWSHLAEVAE